MDKFNEAQLVEEPNAMPQPVEATPSEVVEAQPQAPLAEPSVAEAPVEAPVAEAPVEDAIEEPVETAPELPNTPAEETGNGLFKAPMEGMVPSGWVFPDELAQAVAMVTGDVEASETAPDATVAPVSPQLAPQEPQRESVEEKEEVMEEKVEDLDDKLDALIAKMRKADENGNKEEVEDCKRRMIKLLGEAMKEGKIDSIINDFATDPSEAHPEDRDDLEDVLTEFGYADEKEAIEQAHPELKEACEGEKCEEACGDEVCEEYYDYCEISSNVYSVTCDSSCPFECSTGIGGADDAPFHKGLLFIEDEDDIFCKQYKDALERGVEKFPQEIDVASDETLQKVIEILEKHGFNDHEELPMSKLYPMGANEGMTSILFELPMVPTEEEMENIKGMFDELCALKADDSLEESVEEETAEEEPSEEAEGVVEELPQEEAPVEEIGAEEVEEEPIADLEIPTESEIVADAKEEEGEEEAEEAECDEECKEEVADAVEELKDDLEDAEEPSEVLDATTEFLKKIFGEFEKEEGEEEVEEAPSLDVTEDPMMDATIEEEPTEEEAPVEEEPLVAVELFDGEEVGEPVEDEEEEEEEEILEAVDKFANPKLRKGTKEEEACEKCEESYEVTSENVWDVYDKAMEYLGAEELLISLVKALSTDELEDLFRYIARVYEIDEKVPLRADKGAYIDWADTVVEVYLGGEYAEFSEWLARAMGAWKLADNLEYICRCWDVPCDEEEEEEYEEACKMREEIFVPAGSKLSDDKEEKKAKVAQMAEKADARRETRNSAKEEASKNKFKEALNTPVSKMEEEDIPEDSWEARRIEESKGGRFSWSEFKKIR